MTEIEWFAIGTLIAIMPIQIICIIAMIKDCIKECRKYKK